MNLEAVRYFYLRRVVATAFGALGLEATGALAGRLARGVFDLNTAGRQRAEARLRDALNGTASQEVISAAVAAMYNHRARFWTEVLFAKRLLRDSSWRRFVRLEGEPVLRSMARARRGCVLATAYYGNPPVGAYALGQIFCPLHVIVDPLAQPQLRSWQQELYSQRWIKPIDRRSAAQALPAVLGSGGAVMMVCEHQRPSGRAVPAPFLGRTLNCYPTLGRLARWFDVPIGVFTCRRRGDDGFSFTLNLHATLEHRAAGSDDALVRQVMAVLQQAVMTCPPQYDWSTPAEDPAPAPASRPSDPAARLAPSTTDMETGSAPCRTTGRKASASRTPSAAGRTPENPAAAAELAPTG
jgi:lauroyl/myristoyl acyltransferase